MNKKHLYSAIISALLITNVSVVNAGTDDIKLKENVKEEIKINIPNAQNPTIKTPQVNLNNIAVEQLPTGVEKEIKGLKEKGLIDQAGIGAEIKSGSSISNPDGSGNLDIGPKSRMNDPRGNTEERGRTGIASDPLTGKPLIGGNTGGASESPRDRAQAASSAGKGRASDGTVNDDSTVAGTGTTFHEVHTSAIGNGEGESNSADGKYILIISATGGLNTPKTVTVERYNKDRTYVDTTTYQEGKKPIKTDSTPSPDNAGQATNSSLPLTPTEKAKAGKKKLQLQGRESYEDNGTNDQATNNGRGNLTDLDLAGQPTPDGDSVGGSVSGNIQDDALLRSGQPVDNDDNFGAVNGGSIGGRTVNKNISDKLKNDNISGSVQNGDVPKSDK